MSPRHAVFCVGQRNPFGFPNGDVVERYRQAGCAVTRFVRRTVRIDGNPDMRGGIKGSFPVSGDYGKFEYLAWACKFFIDANLLEQEVVRR